MNDYYCLLTLWYQLLATNCRAYGLCWIRCRCERTNNKLSKWKKSDAIHVTYCYPFSWVPIAFKLADFCEYQPILFLNKLNILASSTIVWCKRSLCGSWRLATIPSLNLKWSRSPVMQQSTKRLSSPQLHSIIRPRRHPTTSLQPRRAINPHPKIKRIKKRRG